MRMTDVIRRSVTVDPHDAIATAAAAMRDQGASSCLVVDGGSVVGTITEHDLVTKIVAENRNPDGVRVREVMSGTEPSTDEQVRGRIIDLLGSPATSLEDAEGVYELALTGTPIDLTFLPGDIE